MHQKLLQTSNGRPIFSPLMVSLVAFGCLGLGAFFVTMPGIWVWLGAACWLLAGMGFAALLVRAEARPSLGPDERAALHQQLYQLDGVCEDLQDKNWELREAEQKYRSLLENQGDLLLHVRPDGTLHYVNAAFEQYFSHPVGDIPFQTEQAEAISDQSSGEAIPQWEGQIQTRQGERYFRWSETLVRSPHSEKTSRLIIARDMTAFRRVQAASDAKSRFLATISHEMRTPLNGIIGMANLLEASPLSAEQKTYSQNLRQSGTSLLALVNDVLDLSRIEAGKLTIAPEWVSAARLLEDVVELLAPDAQEKGLSIASWIGPQVPARILMDPVRVRQILINLLGNAVKFTEQGAINLSLDGIRPDSENQPMALRFSVRDTGPGIVPEMQQRLFDEFEQADTTRARRHEGSGLGLAISRRLAHMMQGDIELASKPGKGSTFSLLFSADWLDSDTTNETAGCELEASSLAGQCLTGIDLTEADRRALYSYCQDWSMEAHFLTLRQWQEEGDKLHPDHLLINGAEPDKAGEIVEGFDPIKSGVLTRPLPKSRVILLEPNERHVIPQMRDSGITAYLVKPMRAASLLSALLGQAKRRDEPDIGIESNEQMPSKPEENGQTEQERAITSPQILLVEDNDINALVAKTNLEKAGMMVTRASAGQEALDHYMSDGYFDLVLIDLHMPDMDGFSLFNAMGNWDKKNNNTKAIPKVAFTADALRETRRACLDHGFDDYLLKPVEPHLMIASIHALLR